MKQIGVVGAGVMGSGIAFVIARAGYQVILLDVSQALVDKGYDYIVNQAAKLVKKEKMTEAEQAELLARAVKSTTMETLKNCDLVIEAVTEQIAVKRQIFTALDQLCAAHTILASNTSSLSITEIASFTNRADRVIGMHFFNPAPIMQLVEIIKGVHTSKQTYQHIVALSQALSKVGIGMIESPGFIVNRLLVPMVNEAIAILSEGVADADSIDRAMRLGANHPIGPLALADLIGNDVCLHIMEVLFSEFGEDKYRPHPLLKKMVRAGKLGRKSGEGFYTYN